MPPGFQTYIFCVYTMLKELYIRDFAIVEELSLSLGPGLTVITGETGAGKSILVEALGLLLGGRASSEVVRLGAERCRVEGLFDICLLYTSPSPRD